MNQSENFETTMNSELTDLNSPLLAKRHSMRGLNFNPNNLWCISLPMQSRAIMWPMSYWLRVLLLQ